ncbi:hypothetical protein DFJ67_3235 [Asanoa ferruginea]|uniref:Ig-like domain-containing protein n=2 Tax=Asanoa ferruginea TaxID=53367 RepID=A0A3D9ZIM0_9ACTN|nr:hypothetical protein DFJ67_3235 [Asanoa ferruginea]
MSRRPAKPGFWDTLPGVFTVLGLLALVTLVVLLRVGNGRSQSDLVADIASCEFHGSSVAVSLTIRNDGEEAGSARIEWEYRDAKGGVVGKDSVVVSDAAPGQTVRREVTTSLDAPTSKGTCEITVVLNRS